MAGEPARLWLSALWRALADQARVEWYGGPYHRLDGPPVRTLAAQPRDYRPADAARGASLLAGTFDLAGARLSVGEGGDPWNRPSPSEPFAARLHRFDWLGDLIAAGEAGAREGLRLSLDWKRVFGRWNGFSWRADILERRVLHWACAGQALLASASDWEVGRFTDSLAQQARHLLQLPEAPPRAAERLIACAAAGVALGGEAGGRLLARALPRLEAALNQAVLLDGGHASRSPQAGLDLLLDLLSLDDGLSQLGRPPSEGVSRAIERLTAAARFFTLPDGRLAAFQGGEAVSADVVAAALDRAASAGGPLPPDAPFSGYQRLSAPGLCVMVDVDPPAQGDWSVAACSQVAALEVVCGRDRLITNCGWSPPAGAADALRLTAGASTVSLGEGGLGAILGGLRRRGLGPRLIGGPARVIRHRRENEVGVWVDLTHRGWLASTGLSHERRLFLDAVHNELRGEDRFMPSDTVRARQIGVAIRFHLAPEVKALIARDRRSVLLRGASGVGWWLRNDASEVAIEPSVVFHDGVGRHSTQIVLRGGLRSDRGGRVRWKLAAAETPAA